MYTYFDRFHLVLFIYRRTKSQNRSQDHKFNILKGQKLEKVTFRPSHDFGPTIERFVTIDLVGVGNSNYPWLSSVRREIDGAPWAGFFSAPRTGCSKNPTGINHPILSFGRFGWLIPVGINHPTVENLYQSIFY